MNDKEIDDILEELRLHRLKEEGGEPPETKAPTPADNPVEIEQVFENKEEEAEPETPSVEEVQEMSAEEDPVTEKVDEPEEEPVTEKVDEPEEEPVAETVDEPEEDALNLFDIITDEENEAEPEESEDETGFEDDEIAPKDSKKKALVIIISAIILLGVIVGAYFGIMAMESRKDSRQSAGIIQSAVNPLTGKNDLSADSVGKRPVAIVVENERSSDEVRPQWGLGNADIVLEGESEYSTRMLLFFADYSKIPGQVGPTRSARPPFIRFAEFFDSIFIHAGLSRSKGDYEGADAVFENDRVDHINLLEFSDDGTYFGRDFTRTTVTEHTAFFNGKNIEKLLTEKNISTEIDESRFTSLDFNTKAEKLSETPGETVSFRWSDERCNEVRQFRFNDEIGGYTTNDFDSSFGEADLNFENLIFLLDKTEYIEKKDYQGKGESEVYCNYKLAGGDGVMLSEGTAINIKWSVENGKLALKTADKKAVKLNPGKTYFGYGSSNNGGKITLNPTTLS